MNGFFLIRAAYVFICWGILFKAMDISLEAPEPELTKSVIPILSGLMLFLLPLSLDYWNHKPNNKKDELRKRIGVGVPVFLFCVYFILMNIDNETVNLFIANPWVKFTIWLFSALFVVLAIQDLIAYSSDEEDLSRRQTREAHREKVIDQRQIELERKQFYQSIRTQRHILLKTAPGKSTKRKQKGGKKR